MTGLFIKYNGPETIFIFLLILAFLAGSNGFSTQKMSLSTDQTVTKQLISGDKTYFSVPSKPSTTGTARGSTLKTFLTHRGNQINVNMTHVIKFNIFINKPFPKELHDPTSERYYRYVTELTNGLLKTFHVLPGFEGILIDGFQDKRDNILCDFYLQTSDISAMTATKEQFEICLNELKMVIVDEATVIVDEQSMLDQYFKATRALSTDDNCRHCSNGTFCTYQNIFSCAHVCSLVSDICRHRGGCLYDPVRNQPACRCPVGVAYDESEAECVSNDQTKNNNQEDNSSKNIAIYASVIPTVLTVIGGTVGGFIRYRKIHLSHQRKEREMALEMTKMEHEKEMKRLEIERLQYERDILEKNSKTCVIL